MSDAKIATVLWPDLSRFGLSLTVAYNPSLGKNLLRLAVMDRDLAARTSGLDPAHNDFFRIMRDVGFAFLPSEILARRRQTARDTPNRTIGPNGEDAAVEREGLRLYFYSPNVAIRKEMLRKIVPALDDSDFRQMPVAEIKHYDFRYVDDRKAQALFQRQQAFAEGDPGVFYTTPQDRALLQRLNERNATIHQALRLSGENTRAAIDLSDPDLAALAALHPIRDVQQLFASQALLADGSALRTVGASATILGYPKYDDAVAANGGDVEGIERVQFPEALPVAFDYPLRRILAVKDGRFLEYGNIGLYGSDSLEVTRSAQYHWDFIDHVMAVRREAETALAAGVFSDERLSGPGIDVASAEIAKLRALMRTAVANLRDRHGPEDELKDVDLFSHSGVTHALLPKVFGQEFQEFVTSFPPLALRVEQMRAAQAAEAATAAGIHAALSKVHAVEAAQKGLRREDAGEKIGGARKDYARRWLAVDELDSMTVRERADVVTKDNVWPAPDYAAMKEQGVAPEVAYCVRELRSALPTNPYRGGYNIRRRELKLRAEKDLTLEQCERFVRAVSLVRDCLSEVRTKADLLNAIAAIHRQSDTQRYGWHSDHWFFDGTGYQFSARALPDIQFDAAGTLKSSWNFERFVALAANKVKGGWEWASKKQRAKTASPEEGAEEAKKVRPEPEVPHLEHIERAGTDYRQGKDVDEQLLMEVFGFRGVEYGNWLPQDERQLVLNHSFDAFMDLSAVLKLPPKAMSLGGDLALAFGSRGRGGKNAACAHYEPARNVINLTRLSGAGALAHEWGHALDYFLAKSCNVSQTGALTERGDKQRRLLPPIAAAFLRLVDEARRRYRSKDEVVTELLTTTTAGGKLTVAELVRSRMEDFVIGLDYSLPMDKRGSVFLEFAKKELDKLIVPTEEDPRQVRMDGVGDFVRNLMTALDLQAEGNWRERLGKNALKYPQQVANWAHDRAEKIALVHKHYDPARYPGESVFLQDAEYYDSFRSKPYWSTRVEMFARGFEAWVQDRVESEPGRLSQYLVFGRNERPDAEHSGYPRGEERARIEAAMTVFFEEYRPELLRRMEDEQPEKSAGHDLAAA